MLTSRALLVPTLPTLLVDEHRRHRTEMLAALAEQATRLQTDLVTGRLLGAVGRRAGPTLSRWVRPR